MSQQPKVTLITADTAELGVKSPAVPRVAKSGPLQAAKLAVPVIVGTRPEAIKLVPIILALRDSDCFHPVIVSTGQHHRMVAEIFELAGIKTDVELWVGSGRAPLNERVAPVMGRFDDFCRERFGARRHGRSREQVLNGRFPAAVLVHGDTTSAMAAALAAFHLRIPVMHVEAGLRTGGLNLTPFPEELNRRLISKIACFHFAPTATNQENLIRENIPEHQIFVTGNTGIDALRWASDHRGAVPGSRGGGASTTAISRIVVVTAHRRENWETGLDGVAEGVRDSPPPTPRSASSCRCTRTRSFASGSARRSRISTTCCSPSRWATPPSPGCSARCHLVITDSGGIQEEAPSLGKPVLVARETTERTEGVEAGTSAPGRHRPRPDRGRGRAPARSTPMPTRDGGGPRTPTATGAPPSGSWRRSSICAGAASRRRSSAPATSRGPCSPRAAGSTFDRARAQRRPDTPSGAVEEDREAGELWPAEPALRGAAGRHWTVLFTFALVVIVALIGGPSSCSFAAAGTAPRRPEAPADGGRSFTWVFLVPALNEEVTIRDSVRAPAGDRSRKRRLVVVIDDGSDDRTPEILRGLATPTCTSSGASRHTPGAARRPPSTTPTASSVSGSAASIATR